MTWVEWLGSLNWVSIIGSTAAIIAAVTGIYNAVLNRREQKSKELRLAPNEEQCLLQVIDLDGR